MVLSQIQDGKMVLSVNKNYFLAALYSGLYAYYTLMSCLCHLIQHLDGKTNHPTGFKGAIGKMLENCEKLSVISFEPIELELPNIDPEELSTDQKYLFDICNGISRGNISMSLSLRHPGKISYHIKLVNNSRQNFKVICITLNPSLDLKILTKYVVKVYSTSWSEIEMKPTCMYGSNHLFEIIKKVCYLSKEHKNIVDPVLQRNAYFCHPENILLAMLVDKRMHIRELGLRQIIKCRESYDNQMSFRPFKVLNLNLNARDYVDMINWQNVNVTEPPLTRQV